MQARGQQVKSRNTKWRLRRSSELRAPRQGELLEPRTVLSTGYLPLSMASDLAGSALVQDPNLVGPWGVTVNSNGTGDLWVVDRGSGLASHYSGAAGSNPFQASSTPVGNLGTHPTGDVMNGSTSFVVHSGSSSGPASVLFASEDGKISGWNASVPPPSPSPSAQTAATRTGAIYKGLTLENDTSRHLIYTADFHDNRIDVFNGSFNPVTLPGSFTDPSLPAGYAPFNIANIGGRLLVSYAVQDANKQNDVPGLAHGIVDAFDYDGNFLGTVIAGGPSSPASKLNSPWGMALAPPGFGDFSGELLVANSGDGKINAFDPATGAFLGTMATPSGNPLVLNGLHGLSFGNGLSAGDSHDLFFTAIGNNGQQGVLGEIVSTQNTQFPAVGDALSGTAHFAVSGMVAVFDDALSAPASGFTATINWGDGTTPEVGTVTALPSGGFGVSGSHPYGAAGQYSVSVRIQDPAGSVATATASASIARPGIVFSSTSVTATEGLQFSGTVANFVDQAGNSFAGFYTSTIDWGDGTTTAGTVSGSGPFTVTGAHTYADQGTDSITVSVTEPVEAVSGTEHVIATVVSSLSGTAVTITPTETTAFSGKVASFTDANTNRSLSDYSATIDWGDGTTTPGTVATNGSGGFDVTGTNTYADEGAENISVAISDPGSTITVVSRANVGDDDTLSAAGSPVSGAEGTTFSGTVATFTDTRPSAPASDFAATIVWGDGTTTAGTVTEAAGIFTISGAHAYLDEGSFTIVSTVNDVGGTASASAQSTASIAEADVLTITPITFSAVAGATFTGEVATAHDSNLAALAGDFTAIIAWGDGTTTAGVVSGGSGNFTITGSHAYANEGTASAIVRLADDAPGTATATTTSTAEVTPAPPAITTAPVSGPERASITAQVATFTEPGSSAGANSFTATIAWGDGATSAGVITASGNGFAVTGTHVYADEHAYNFSVTVSRTGGPSATAGGVATIVEPTLADATAGTPVTRWVNEIYTDLLNRNADAGALAYWSGQVSAGLSRTQVVAAIEGSAEYRGDEVQTVFETYLHRAAEPSAQAFGTQYLVDHSVEQLAELVIGSSEYYQNRGGGTNDGFLDALYSDALHRAVDDSGRAYFDRLLSSGTSTSQVAAMIFASDEYLNDLVDSFYLELLDRPADSGGQAYFAGQLKQGVSDGQVIALLAGSDEYFAKTSP